MEDLPTRIADYRVGCALTFASEAKFEIEAKICVLLGREKKA
jgi:hypothetical protein